jgi:hypothetical protein
VPNLHNKGDASEDKVEVRVYPEPRISMKHVQTTVSKGKGPKTINTPS